MNLIVQKFGGSSVKDAQRIKNVAEIIADTYSAGNNVLVVLSAQGLFIFQFPATMFFLILFYY